MAKNSTNVNNLGLSPEEAESEKALLRASYAMYEQTKQETEKVRKTAVDKNGKRKYSDKSLVDTMRLIENMEGDIVKKYLLLGGTEEELKESIKNKRKKGSADRKKLLEEILKKELRRQEILEQKGITEEELEGEPKTEVENPSIPDDGFPVFDGSEPQIVPDEENSTSNDENEPEEPENDEKETDYSTIQIDVTKAKGNNIKYDVIPLPSKGEAYKNKMSKIPVAYLTAYDENLIVSPNLYKDGTFLDYMLKTKIMTDAINSDDLLPGDRDAIILWLRASGYGPEYPVSAVDNETGQRFETVVDLTKIKFKKFKLKGDANGHFSFTLPFSKDKIKFKFLSYKDNKALEKLDEQENIKLKKTKLNDINEDLKSFIENDDTTDRALRVKLTEATKAINEYAESLNTDDDALFSHSVTNKLSASIVSVNNVTDRKYIDEYVMFMNVKDSSALRKYITENEPGIDFNVTVEKPASIGGGSLTMFLTLDQFIFLNIA